MKIELDPSMQPSLFDFMGAVLRDFRKEKNLSQGDLANLVCVSRVQVSLWENGKCSATTSRLDSLARALQIPLSEFIARMEMYQKRYNDI